MGRKKKFDKIGRNETYYAAYGDETQQDEKKESSTKKEKKKKTLFDIDPGNVPEKKEPSSKFKYKKEKRKAVEKAQPVEEVEAPSKAPLVLALISFSIILLMQAFVQSGLLAGLSNSMKTTVSLVFYAIAYIVPVVVYMIINYSRIKFHNIRWFSFSHIPFAVACLGFAVAATALQKYAIAYSSSYSMGLHDIMNTENGFVMTIVMVALVPAICEELLLRGVLQYELSSYAGGLCGILMGAIISGMIRLDLRYFFVYFVLGLVFGVLTHVTRSCVPSMVVHFLINALSILFSEKLSFVAIERIGGTLLMIILAIVTFILLITVLQLAENISAKRSAVWIEKEKDTEKAKEMAKPHLLVSDKGRTFKRNLLVFGSPLFLIIAALFVIVSAIGMSLL